MTTIKIPNFLGQVPKRGRTSTLVTKYPRGELKHEPQGDVILPWPPKELNPNFRGHWLKKAKAAKAYRKECWVLCKQAGIKIDWEGDIDLCIRYCPPDNRRRDLDNLLSSTKAGLDGIADALGVNDHRFRISIAVEAELGGKVRVRFSRGQSGSITAPPQGD